MNKRLAAGEIDRLELTFAKLELNAVEKNLALAHYQLKMAEAELENTLQKPLIQSTQSLDIESISLKSASH
jgi:outer membrane protein TolC